MSERNRKANYMKQSGARGTAAWILLIVFLIKMVYMSYKNGMQGMTYYAYADALFMTVYILLGTAVVPVLKKMIYFQMNHGSYRNAGKVYRTISGLLFLMTVVIAVVLFICSEPLSRIVFGTKLCSLLLKFMAGAILFCIPMFCLKGYMEGIGNPMPGIFADVLMHVSGLVVTVLFQPMFAGYGRKVAALMRQDSYAYAYSACSGALGLMVGSVLGFLFLLLVRSVFGRELRKRVRTEEVKKTDSVQDILWNFFGGYFSAVFVDNIGVILGVVLMILYCHTAGRTESGAGMLFVGLVVLSLPAAYWAMQIANPFVRSLTTSMKQSDFYQAKEKTAFYLKLLSYSMLPYVTVGFAIAPLVAEVLFDTESASLVSMIRIGMGIALLLVFGILFRRMLSVLVKPYVRNLYAGLLGVSGVVFFIIFDRSSMIAEECAAYSYMMACLLYLLVICFAVFKKIRVYNQLLKSILIPFVSAAVTAVVVFGMYMLLDGKMAAWILLIAAVLVAYVLHNAVIALVKIFQPHEWSSVPASGFAVYIAKLAGRYSE